MGIIHDVLFAHQDTEASWSHDGRHAFFLRDVGEEYARRNQVHQLETESGAIRTLTNRWDGDITKLYVSPYSTHIAYLIDTTAGTESNGLVVIDYSSGTEEPVPKQRKQIFGGWTEDGLLFFERLPKDDNNPDNDKWSLSHHEIGRGRAPTDIERDVGYYPDLLGRINGKPLVINQHATFNNKIRWNGEEFAYGDGDDRQERLRSGTNAQDGNLFCIRENMNEHAGEIVKFSIQDRELTDDATITSETILKKIGDDEQFPRGEIENFVVEGDDAFVVNLNLDGSSKLYRVNGDEWNQIDLGIIEETLGEHWVEGMSYNEKQGLLLTVSSFSTPQHLWRLTSEDEQKPLTTPSFRLPKMEVVTDVFQAHNDGVDMQYFEIKPKDDDGSAGTVIFFHGGPAIQTTRKWDRVIATFLAKGFRVVAPNPRGSTGRGACYAGLDDGEGRRDLIETEVGPFVKHINDKYDGKPFIYGGSYGGWLVLSLITSEYGEYIEASASRNGIVDMGEFLNRTIKWRRKHRKAEYIGDSEQPVGLMIALSPLHAEEQELRRVLLIYGENDSRVTPLDNMEFTRKFGLEDDRLPPFDDEGHKIKRLTNLKKSLILTIKLFEEE